MTRRNLTTTFMVVTAGLLLFGGVALAREAQTRDDHRDQVIATQAAKRDRRQRRTDSIALIAPTARPTTRAADTARRHGQPDGLARRQGQRRTRRGRRGQPDGFARRPGGTGGHGATTRRARRLRPTIKAAAADGSDDAASPTADDPADGHCATAPPRPTTMAATAATAAATTTERRRSSRIRPPRRRTAGSGPRSFFACSARLVCPLPPGDRRDQSAHDHEHHEGDRAGRDRLDLRLRRRLPGSPAPTTETTIPSRGPRGSATRRSSRRSRPAARCSRARRRRRTPPPSAVRSSGSPPSRSPRPCCRHPRPTSRAGRRARRCRGRGPAPSRDGQRPDRDHDRLGHDDRPARRRVGEQAADRAVGELAAEDPGGEEREEDRAADRDRLAEQVQERRPVGRPRGELRLCAEQPERAGALGVLEDDHEQAADQRAPARSRRRRPTARASDAP